MGATVTTAKRAAAFKASNGQTYFVLFEESFEKNVFPHTPRWNCHLIGLLEHAMERIFLGAASCESGMLQNRNGTITPEGYIGAWLKELAAPALFDDMTLDLYLGSDFYSPVSKGALETVRDELEALGRGDIVIALEQGQRVPISLHADTQVVMALYGSQASMSPWRVIRPRDVPGGEVRFPELGYAPTAAKSFEVVVPAFLKVDGENRLIQLGDGTWICGGWEYSAVQNHIRNLWEVEMREPGSYRTRIKSYRDAIKAAPLIPDGMKIVVDETIPVESSYERTCMQDFANGYSATRTATGYQVAVERDEEFLYRATNLPSKNTKWVSPDRPAQAPDGQLSLLVA